MSKFALLPEIDLNDRMSQTFLRHANACMRSAYFYSTTRGASTGVNMVRGSAVHRALELCTLEAMGMEQPAIPPHVAKSILDAVLEEMHVPFEEHDYIRECVFRWAETAVFSDRVMGVEQLFTLDVDGVQVRAKIDHLEMGEDGRTPHVIDYKSGRGAPLTDEVSRTRADGTLMPRNFQLVLYGLMVVFGRPVREEFVELRGRGEDPAVIAVERKEIIEPLSIAPRAQGVTCEFVYPGIPGSSGMYRQEMSLTRLELEEYMDSLRALVKHVKAAEVSRDWPALQSDMGCTECDAPGLCPIPRELRDFKGLINTDAEAAEAAEKLDREKADHAARRKELKLYVQAIGPVRWGKDKISRFVTKETTSVKDRAGMLAEVQMALQGKATFDEARWVKTREAVSFVDQTLSTEEQIDGGS